MTAESYFDLKEQLIIGLALARLNQALEDNEFDDSEHQDQMKVDVKELLIRVAALSEQGFDEFKKQHLPEEP